jgi:hypothetical protein
MDLDLKLNQYLDTYPGIRLNRIERIRQGESISFFGDLTADQRASLKVRLEALMQPAATPLEGPKRKSSSPDSANKRKSPSPKPVNKATPSEIDSRVYLFDIDRANIDDIRKRCPKIRWYRPRLNPAEQVSFETLINELSGNPYLEYLKTQFTEDELQSKYHLVDGLTLDDEFWRLRISELQAKKNPILLLAWDGALTKFDALPVHPSADQLEAELEFLFGGKQRLNSMRLLISRFHDDGIKSVILTNSKECGSPHFIALMMAFSSDLEFVCTGGQSPGQRLENDPAFEVICRGPKPSVQTIPPTNLQLEGTIKPNVQASTLPFEWHEDVAAAAHLVNHGFAVIRHPWFVENVVSLNQQFIAAMTEFPEYREPRQPLLNKFVGGGFAALGNPASFHNPLVRKLRLWCEAAMVPVLRAMAIRFDKHNVEQIVDRMLFRLPKVEVQAETWHRDETPAAAEGDHIFGGWINLDPAHSQQFSCIPGSHLPGQNSGGGFAKIKVEKIPDLNRQRQVISIPPGCIMIIYENIIHEVVKKPFDRNGQPVPRYKRDYPIVRLFLGWRLTNDTTSLLDRLNKSNPLKYASLDVLLAKQAVMPIKSGQIPSMYPSRNWAMSGQREQLVQWSKKTFVDGVLISQAVQSGPMQGQYYQVVQNPMFSLQDNGLALYKAYMPSEIAILKPNSALKLPDPGATSGFKFVQIGIQN